MKKISLFLVCICLMTSVFGQNVTINPTGITPQTSSSYPRITYNQILALPSPLKGDLAYDLTFDCLRVFNGVKWLNLLTGQDINKAASLTWALKSNDFLSVVDIEKDANGNIFVIGNFKQTATFGTVQKTAVGDNDVFLAKYTDTGTL